MVLEIEATTEQIPSQIYFCVGFSQKISTKIQGPAAEKDPQKGIKMNTQNNSTKLAKMAMLVAVSIVLVALIHLPILPMVPFLEYDPADIPILLGSFAFGPGAGIILTLVTAILQGVTVSAQSGAYGIIMHIIATSALVLVSGLIYSREKTKKNAIIGLVCGTLAMVLIMIPANMLITTRFMGLTLEALMPFMPWIILFNFIKAGVNSVVTFLVYKRISPFLHK